MLDKLKEKVDSYDLTEKELRTLKNQLVPILHSIEEQLSAHSLIRESTDLDEREAWEGMEEY